MLEGKYQEFYKQISQTISEEKFYRQVTYFSLWYRCIFL